MNKIQEIIDIVEGKKEKFIKVSDDVWSTPELYFHEEKSCQTLLNAIKSEGFSVEEGIAGIPTAFVATYGAGKPVIGILGELDALPQLSQEAANPVKTEIVHQGPGHGCGHNAIGAGALGGAVAVKDYMEKNGIKGTIKYFACPAEEGGSGKSFIVNAGYFKDVDAAITWHPDSKNYVMGISLLANQSVYFNFKGKTAHAAGSPHLGRSALDACELMNVGVNYLREHVIQEARIHYAYQDAGGVAPNIVQDYASVKYYIRAPKISEMLEISERIKNVACGAALMTDTQLVIDVEFGMCDYQPNSVISQILTDSFMEVGGPKFDEADEKLAMEFFKNYSAAQIENDQVDMCNVVSLDKAKSFEKTPLISEVFPYERRNIVKAGSSDVGDVSYAVPTAWVNVAGLVNGTPLHSWLATAMSGSSIMHKAVISASKALALAAVKLMEDPDALARAKEEYVKTTGGEYISPVGKDVKPRL